MDETNKTIYSVNAIADGFWSIGEGHVRCFLIEGTERAMLVDTGLGTGDIKSLAESLTRLPVFVVNTHADSDHTGCNRSFGKVAMHRAEAGYYRMKKPGDNIPIEHIRENDTIDLGNRKFEAIHIPGHTPGSIALLDRKNKLLLSGDSVQTDAVYMFGEGRDMNAYIESMKKLEGMMHLFETILPSHGDIPIKPDIIPDLITVAQRVVKGEIEGQTPPRPLPCKLYAAGRAKFLYSR